MFLVVQCLARKLTTLSTVFVPPQVQYITWRGDMVRTAVYEVLSAFAEILGHDISEG